jgi:U4/U6.U5 tri-snRNP component SNU23
MRVERAGVDDVKERLEALKRKVSNISQPAPPKLSAFEEYEARMKKEEEEKELFKRRRKEEVAAKKNAIENEPDEEDADVDEDAQEEMMATLGFAGFGSSKKKK